MIFDDNLEKSRGRVRLMSVNKNDNLDLQASN